jgi:hypothetical protein
MVHPIGWGNESDGTTDDKDDAGFVEHAEETCIGFWLVGAIGFGFCAGEEEGIVLWVQGQEDCGRIYYRIDFEVYCESEEKTCL